MKVLNCLVIEIRNILKNQYYIKIIYSISINAKYNIIKNTCVFSKILSCIVCVNFCHWLNIHVSYAGEGN